VDSLRIGKNPLVMKWDDFKELLKSKFYPMGYKEEELMK
jgi:hypothetical protein